MTDAPSPASSSSGIASTPPAVAPHVSTSPSSTASHVGDPPMSPPAAPASAVDSGSAARGSRALVVALIVVAVLAVAAIVLAWRAEQRVRGTERELVKRQQDSAVLITEATLLARQAQESARDAAARVALLDARVNEVALQRGQLEALMQSVARARDENLVAESEATLRAAMQQSALTGSAEPTVAALKQIDDRLARTDQPRLEPVRRAVARDLDRVKAASVADVSALSIRIEEAVRMVDELPLVSVAEPRRDAARAPSSAASADAPASAAAASGIGGWFSRTFGSAGRAFADNAWSEIRSLVRVTRIDRPEAMLVAPDQAFFLRENMKLRLLNARLSLLARQFDAAQGDLRWVMGAIERYCDRASKRTQIALDLLGQVLQQARQSAPMRPDDTFAALAAAAGAR